MAESNQSAIFGFIGKFINFPYVSGEWDIDICEYRVQDTKKEAEKIIPISEIRPVDYQYKTLRKSMQNWEEHQIEEDGFYKSERVLYGGCQLWFGNISEDGTSFKLGEPLLLPYF